MMKIACVGDITVDLISTVGEFPVIYSNASVLDFCGHLEEFWRTLQSCVLGWVQGNIVCRYRAGLS